jgi:uncharacterized membrane protein
MGGETRTNRWTRRGIVVVLGIMLALAAWATIGAIWTLAVGGTKALNAVFDSRWFLPGPGWVAGDPMYEGLFDFPAWAVAHFVTALAFVILVPFQLSAYLRNRYRVAHRIVGWVAVTCGVVFALTGLVLPQVMPARPFGERAFFTIAGLGYLFLLWRGVAAARRGDIPTHRRWMLRVTALALSPATWRVIFPFFAATGIDSINRFWDLFTAALWTAAGINFGIVEWWLYLTSRARARPALSAGSPSGKLITPEAATRHRREE